MNIKTFLLNLNFLEAHKIGTLTFLYVIIMNCRHRIINASAHLMALNHSNFNKIVISTS